LIQELETFREHGRGRRKMTAEFSACIAVTGYYISQLAVYLVLHRITHATPGQLGYRFLQK
jgi:hypothetical protein